LGFDEGTESGNVGLGKIERGNPAVVTEIDLLVIT
jgi:hypothetical protein